MENYDSRLFDLGGGEIGQSRTVRVIFKARSRFSPPGDADFGDLIRSLKISRRELLAKGLPPLALRSALKPVLYTCTDALAELERRARILHPDRPLPSFKGYFYVEFDISDFYNKNETRYGVETIINNLLSCLRDCSEKIAYHHIESPPVPIYKECESARGASQCYLERAPLGIDAQFAYYNYGRVGKGDSAGLLCIDLERGWEFDRNEDLRGQPIKQLSGVNYDEIGHGTAVLGILIAKEDGEGGLRETVGIVPKIPCIGLVSQHREPELGHYEPQWNEADALLCALAELSPGDVLLVESQVAENRGGTGRLPVEVEKVKFDLIYLGSASGVVIVEAAGNGCRDLGAYLSYGDSGAVLVAAGSWMLEGERILWRKESCSNWGERVDCFSWGQDVLTTAPFINPSGVTSFGCTSAATAIIAGAALSLQAILGETRGRRLRPESLRELLKIGTRAQAQEAIGVMPNLKGILEEIMKLRSSDIEQLLLPARI